MLIKIIPYLCFLLLVLSTGCSDSKNPVENTSPETTTPWMNVLHSHTTGQISRFDSIDFHFNQDLPEKISEQFLDIEPAIKGLARQVNKRLYRFTPSEPLESGMSLSVTLKPSHLKSLANDFPEYQFSLNVLEQAFQLEISGLKAINDEEMKLNGSLTTSDITNLNEVTDLISTSYMGSSLVVNWDDEESAKQRGFSVSGIKRKAENNNLIIAWDGSSIGVNDKGQRTFQVPAIGSFIVSSINPVQGSDQIIEINFSEKLNEKQDLRGLVQISKGSFRTKIEGSKLSLFLQSPLSGEILVSVDASVKNSKDFKLGRPVNKTLNFLSKKPAVKFLGKGNILPVTDQLTIPFESVNVDSVQVTAFKVYENNMGQFFQSNTLEDTSNIKRVGRYLWRKTIQLNAPVQDKWNRYNLDVKDLVQNNPGSLFRFELSINRSNSIFPCSADDTSIEVIKERPFGNYEDNNTVENSGWDGIETYYNHQSRNWKDRKNPCKDAYYQNSRDVKGARNFIGSDIGLIAKSGENNQMLVAVTKLSTGEVLSGAEINVTNFQGQVIASQKTDSNGFSTIELTSSPFLITAKHSDDVGYLKVNKALALSTSHFDVGGNKSENGIKGSIYLERGVWRPGDEIFLTVVIEDKNNAVPDNHPLTLELFNPKNQRVSVQVNSNPLNGFYTFTLKTDEEDMTGAWKAVASLGNLKFTANIPIETVKPNHLKVNVTLNEDEVTSFEVKKHKSKAILQGEFYSQWLHGGKAAGLKADIKLKMRSQRTRFDRYTGFSFDDPIRSYSGREQNLTEFKLDKEGKFLINAPFEISSLAAGKLKGTLTSRVFEPSGDFSIAKQSIDIHPYKQYVGLSMPKGDAARGMLLTDEKQKIELVVVDTKGNPVIGKQELDVSLYKLSWKWWWDSSSDNLASYTSRYSKKPLIEESIEINDGQGTWDFEVKYPAWGRYMMRVCDKNGYHCVGKVFYMDWPGWAGRGQKKKGLGASTLSMSSDKAEYLVGDNSVVTLPEATTGKALVTIENGSRILKHYWVELSEQGTQLQVPIEESMTPNVYVSVSVIQPHANKTNDEAIRLMGIIPIYVKNPETHLQPKMEIVKEVQPESDLTFTVAETNGKPMTYTVAVVDEGLLGLTQYKTPNLHKKFYKKEALGVSTWDLYDRVVGAYGASLGKLLAIGGDGSEKNKDDESEDRRFPPVVKFIGPFHLDAQQTQSHTIKIPQYLGAVRVMVVAGYEGAYGSEDSEVYVRKPLNVMATLPRVLGQDETLQMPVALFSTQDDVKDVTIKVTANDHLEVLNANQTVSFDSQKEKMLFVALRAKKPGNAKITVTAQSGNYSAQQVINIPVQYQVQEQRKSSIHELLPNEDTVIDMPLIGVDTTQKASIELTAMPPLNLKSNLEYLVQYPHGCVEQTTSRALPQVLLPELVNLSDENLQETQNHVAAAIDKLQRYQMSDGGFSYWPGMSSYHDWASSYAGHLLILAKERGFDVPQEMYNAWTVNQKQGARSWTSGNEKTQAYRLFVLALSGSHELGAMNRLRQNTKMDDTSKLLLAASYQMAGQVAASEDLVSEIDLDIQEYDIADTTFGSKLRDEAISLMSLIILKDETRIQPLIEKISLAIRDQSKRYSTQTTAFTLLAMAQYGKTLPLTAQKVMADWQGENKEIELTSIINLFELSVKNDAAELKLTSDSQYPLYITAVTSGIPEKGKEIAFENEVGLTVRYFDSTDKEIELSQIGQGQDVRAVLTVTNESVFDLPHMSLTYPVASGFEIRTTAEDGVTNQDIEYQDVRDDRIFTYFELKKEESKTFEYELNASYQGRYYQPAVLIEDMYEASRGAKNLGYWIEIVR